MSTHIVHVNESDFHPQVIEHSIRQPVVVEFWAAWCIACRPLSQLLEQLTEERAGTFRLAKLDVDINTRLAKELGVKDIPALRAFRNGQGVAEINGVVSKQKLLDLVHSLSSGSYNIEVGRAEHLLTAYSWAEAEEAFRLVLQDDPDHPAALLGLAKALLSQGDFSGALPILRNFPASKHYATAEQLIPLAQAMADSAHGDLPNDELSAVFANSLRLAGHGQLDASMDGLLELLRQNKRYNKGVAHKAALGVLVLLGEHNPQTHAYRKELASLLF